MILQAFIIAFIVRRLCSRCLNLRYLNRSNRRLKDQRTWGTSQHISAYSLLYARKSFAAAASLAGGSATRRVQAGSLGV